MKEKVSLPLWLHPDNSHNLCFSPVFVFLLPYILIFVHIYTFFFVLLPSNLLVQSAVTDLCPSAALLVQNSHGSYNKHVYGKFGVMGQIMGRTPFSSSGYGVKDAMRGKKPLKIMKIILKYS